MREINYREVHKKVESFFEANNLNYSLIEKTRFDIRMREFVRCVLSDDKIISGGFEFDLGVFLFDEYLMKFHNASIVVKDGLDSFYSAYVDDVQMMRIHEENRRIEQMDVRQF